jgi:hypothetical protein
MVPKQTGCPMPPARICHACKKVELLLGMPAVTIGVVLALSQKNPIPAISNSEHYGQKSVPNKYKKKKLLKLQNKMAIKWVTK